MCKHCGACDVCNYCEHCGKCKECGRMRPYGGTITVTPNPWPYNPPYVPPNTTIICGQGAIGGTVESNSKTLKNSTPFLSAFTFSR